MGLICFGDMTDRFGNLTETFRTLFSVVNGDIIYDTFQSLEFAGIGGQIYVYFYIILFTYGKLFCCVLVLLRSAYNFPPVVLMTIIAIVEEAFFECQQKKSITNSTTIVHTSRPSESGNRPSIRSSQTPSPSNTNIAKSNNSGMYDPPRQASTEIRNNLIRRNTTEEMPNPAVSLSSRQSSFKSTSASIKSSASASVTTSGVHDDYRNRAPSNASSLNASGYDSTAPSVVATSYDSNNAMGYVVGGGSNQNTPLGKRDLPDHLKYLLQRIPSNSNLASSGATTSGTAGSGNVLHAMMPTSTNIIWNRSGSNRAQSTNNRSTSIAGATSGSNINTPDRITNVSPAPSWNSQTLIDEDNTTQ